MAIGDDFAIDYTNKRIYHVSGTTVYSVNALYSWLMDTFDELTQMDDPVPMSAQTPTEYTMINGWFIDDASSYYGTIKFLNGGAIKTSGYAGQIQVLTLSATGYTNCVSTDIGKMVTDDGANTGNLLAFDNTARKWWIRWTSTIASASVMAIVTGTGAGTAAANSVSGEDLYANVYTLGTIESAPYAQIYIFQAGNRISEWSNLSNWDRGHIDVLIKVKEAGTEIDGAVITVFIRQSGDLYDNYEIDLTAGGRNAVPLGTSDDLNEDTGDYYLLYDAKIASFTTMNQIVTGGTSGAYAELIAVTDWGTTGLMTLKGVRGTFQDNETITGSANGSATVNGTIGDTYGTYSAVSVQLTIGLVCTGGTSGAKRILRGIQSDGTTGKYVFQVSTTATGSARTPYYKNFSSGETITDTATGSVTSGSASTTIISGWDDITIAFVNGTVAVGTITGTYTPGERVTYTGGEAILLKAVAGTLTLGNVTNTALNTKVITGDISGATCTASADLVSAHTMDKAFEQQSAYPYDVIVNAGSIYQAGRTLAQVYQYFKFVCRDGSTFQMYTVAAGVITKLDGQEYIIAYSGYSPSKAAPLGTFAGGKYFGAQGVWIEGMATGQSYSYKDSNGVVRDPYVSVAISITNTISGDRISVFRTTGGTINEAMYYSGTNATGDTTFKTTGTLATDTPASGVVRVVQVSTNEKQRYRYASWSGSVLTLETGASGTADTGSTATTLVDTTGSFDVYVKVGDRIRNTTDNSRGDVIAIISSSQLTAPLSGGTNNYWSVNNNYYTNRLDRTYASGTDTAYVPFIDREATTTSVVQSILYAADRDVLIRARNKTATILPFETTGIVTTAGLSVAVIRTPDAIVT
jgi:hypothetical protein